MTLAIKDIKSKLSLLPLEQQRDVLKLLEQYETAKNKEEAKKQGGVVNMLKNLK